MDFTASAKLWPDKFNKSSRKSQSPPFEQAETTQDLSQAYSQATGRNKKINWTMTIPQLGRTF